MIIDEITLNIKRGDSVSIIGPNGSGKSTLIKLLSGEINPTKGSVSINGKNINKWDVLELAKIRSILPQNNHLTFPFSVIDIIKMGRYPFTNDQAQNNDKIYEELIHIFELDKHVSQNYTTLSGGEQQRVQLARVFAQIWSNNDYTNKILIIDEPTSFLDIKHQYALFDFLKKMNKKGLSIISVLHDLNHAIMNSKKILILKNGKVVKFGVIEDIISEEILMDVFEINIKLNIDKNSNKQFISYF